MRIVQITRECSRHGGVGTYVHGLTRALEAAGHDVLIVHADPSLLNLALAGQPTGRSNCPQVYVPDFDKYDTAARCRARSERVLEILQDDQPDLVLIQGNNNFQLEAEIRRRFDAIKFLHVFDFCPSGNKYHHASESVCQHATGPMCLPRMGYKRCTLSKRPRVLWNFYRRCVESNRNNAQYGRLIVASEYVRQQAMASGYGASQLHVLPYFTDLPELRGEAGDARHLLFVGRIEREKGLDKLFQAVRRIDRDWRLTIAGDGTDRIRTKRLAQSLGLIDRIEFVGWADAARRDELYRSASVVVVPSIWPEPFGIVGIEAMSYGKPVVAFRVGGIPEWLEEGRTGFAIEPYDVAAMADRLTALLDHPELAAEMGVCGRRSVEEKFTAAEHVARLMEIIRNVTDARTGRTAAAL